MIYPKKSGYLSRVNKAKKYIINYADKAQSPFCRDFESVFEGGDAEAVIYKIMEECLKKRKFSDKKYVEQQALIYGVKLLGDNVYTRWASIYREGKEQTYDLFCEVGYAL